MLTLDYVKEHLNEIERDDFLDKRFTNRFLDYVPCEEWKDFGYNLIEGAEAPTPKEWTEEIKNEFLKLVSKPYVTRISILGGCPLAAENREDVLKLVKEIRDLYPEKKIWLFTGYKWENIFDSLDGRKKIVELCDVLVDGPFEEDKKDLTLKFRGSKNQRLIDVQASLKNGEVALLAL